MQPFVVSPGSPAPEYVAHAVAVYDRQTGQVVHAHHALRLATSPQPDEAALVHDALEHAREAGHDVSALATVTLNELRTPGSYAIDVKTRTPIAITTRTIDPAAFAAFKAARAARG
jgi:hypothetical protein